VLVVPGFVCFFVFRRVTAWDRKFSDLETIVWSVFISLIMYSLYGLLLGFSSIDAFTSSIFQPLYLATLIVAIGLSAAVGFIVKITFRRTVQSGEVWDVFCDDHVAAADWVTVYTKDGLEYKGRLLNYGFGESKKEITVLNPKLILRDKSGKAVRETPCGVEMIFTEGDVLRMAALNSGKAK
jgi:hypothetical protein